MKGWVDLRGWLHTEIKCRLRELNPDTSPIPVLTGLDVDTFTYAKKVTGSQFNLPKSNESVIAKQRRKNLKPKPLSAEDPWRQGLFCWCFLSALENKCGLTIQNNTRNWKATETWSLDNSLSILCAAQLHLVLYRVTWRWYTGYCSWYSEDETARCPLTRHRTTTNCYISLGHGASIPCGGHLCTQ